MKSVKMLSEELEVSKQTIFNNIKRLNIETVKQENTSFIKEDTDVEKIIKRVNENKRMNQIILMLNLKVILR